MSDLKLETFDKRASQVKKAVSSNNGKAPEKVVEGDGSISKETIKAHLLTDMKSAVKQLDAMRMGSKDRKALDLTWAEFVKEKWGFAPSNNGSPDSFYEALGVNPSHHTVENLFTMPEFEEGYRWLVPEVFRESIRLGLRRQPIYQNMIAGEETVNAPSVIMPAINLSDATPRRLNEAETIPTGTISFAQKTVKLWKVGIGIKITDEVQRYASLNILALYLQDVGVKMNLALDTLMIDTLINGDGNSNPAAVIGVDNTTNGFRYIDLLRAWIRMGRLGRMPNAILSNETPAMTILELEEFKKGYATGTSPQRINVRTPVPTAQDYFVHGAMVDDTQLMLIDASSALIKLNASALRVESERIVDKQVNGTFVTVTTGFANLFDDARLLIDKDLAFSGNGFPAYMNPAGSEILAFGGN